MLTSRVFFGAVFFWAGVALAQSPDGVASLSGDPVATTQPVAAELDPALAAEVKRLMELLGAARQNERAVQQLTANLDRMAANASEEFKDQLRAQVNMDELVNIQAMIYAQHLSPEDVRRMVEFLETPVGSRFIEAQQQIVPELQRAYGQWNTQIRRTISEMMRAERERQAAEQRAATQAAATTQPAGTTPPADSSEVVP